METRIAYRGVRLTIEFAIRSDESVPALDFFNGLDRQWKGRFAVLYTRLGDVGFIHNSEQFSKFVDEFFKFKAYQYRMPCYFRTDKRVVITHGFIKKKKGAAPRQEEDRARNIKKEYEEKLTSGDVNRRKK